MFIRPSEDLVLKTKKGELRLAKTEYYIVDKDGNLVINKEGVQKIEDFFNVNTQIIGEGGVLGNIFVKVRMSTPDGLTVERIGSANNKNLTTDIARAYPFEMAFKRACATAALEILRKNYTGEESLPLLYSSFDEFKTENSVNQGITIVEVSQETPTAVANTHTDALNGNSSGEAEVPVEKENEKPVGSETETETETPVENTESVEEDKNNTVQSLGQFVIKSNKYRKGITLAELAEKDINYLKWIATGENMLGRFQEYQKVARQFIEEAGITLPA